jgi:hypothetical protein
VDGDFWPSITYTLLTSLLFGGDKMLGLVEALLVLAVVDEVALWFALLLLLGGRVGELMVGV